MTTGATGSKMRVIATPTAPAAHSCTGCATELANADVSVYTLMKLLGHESMVTSQRYVAAGAETRTAASQNTLYDLLSEER